MSRTSPRTGDTHEAVSARLKAIGTELGRIHVKRLELMSQASDTAREAAQSMTVDEISHCLGLAPATVRSFLTGG